jgi:hypothetical protein
MSKKCSPPAASRKPTKPSARTASTGKPRSGTASPSHPTNGDDAAVCCPHCSVVADDHFVASGLAAAALFYGYLKNTDLDRPTLRAYHCVSCNKTWQTMEVIVDFDPLSPGALVGLGGHLRAATGTGVSLNRLSLSEQQNAARDALVRQGRARRAVEDRRIDREAEEKAAPAYLAPARRPGRKK